jgi:FlaA1/EpsC-like NDP-sugar epimerase
MLAILHDIAVIPLAWFGAYWFRFNLYGIPNDDLMTALSLFPTILVVQTGAYWIVGLYRGIWRFASIPDLMRIFRAVIMGAGLSMLILFFVTRLNGFPRSVLPIYSLLMVFILGGSRFAVRWFKDSQYLRNPDIKRVLIVGADQAGEGIARDLLRDKKRNHVPVIFVDDRMRKIGQEIHGIRVAGQIKDIPFLVEKHQIDLIIIAMPSARAEEMRRIVTICEETTCPIRTLPGLSDLVTGRVSVDLLREVSLEDLLGRDPVSIDWQAIATSLSNKVILVSGGAGSIGSELCRQIARQNPKMLVVVEQCEFNLFSLEQEFAETFPDLNLAVHLMNVGDNVAMQQVLAVHKPDVIFHAAAYKHVPMLQCQPREAIVNNVLGTRCLAQLAVAYKVKKFILISTDKAVNPTNIMGATKRVTEIICHSLNGSGITKFITVRFGNVLGSAGSVVPTFKRQLEQGGPITVTHPDITRFFMTIPEACQLILQALALGTGGEVFVLDMGEPVKIRFLAEQIIRLAGKKIGEDIEIKYTGLRPGEKLHEELFLPSENLGKTQHEKIFRAESQTLNWVWLSEVLNAMEEACEKYDERRLRALLHQLVPELEIKNEVA